MVWNCPASDDYEGPFLTVSVPFASLQQAVQQKITRDLYTMAATAVNIVFADGSTYSELAGSIEMISQEATTAVRNLSGLTINLFADTSFHKSYGFSLSPNPWMSLYGKASNSIAVTLTGYGQLLPRRVVRFE